jgi:hypothetical protein
MGDRRLLIKINSGPSTIPQLRVERTTKHILIILGECDQRYSHTLHITVVNCGNSLVSWYTL